MIYTDNDQIVKEIKKILVETDTKQIDIANKLGVPKQAITKILDKKNINMDDMKKLLACCGYCVNFEFVPISDNKQ